MFKRILIVSILLSVLSCEAYAVSYDKMTDKQRLDTYTKLRKEQPYDKKIYIGTNVFHCNTNKYFNKGYRLVVNSGRKVYLRDMRNLGCDVNERVSVGFVNKVDRKRGLVRLFWQEEYTTYVQDGWFRAEDLITVAQAIKEQSRYN